MITLEQANLTESGSICDFERSEPAHQRGSLIWFEPRAYGWGFGAPTCWQGWAAWVGFLSMIGLSYVVEKLFFPTGATESLGSGLRYMGELFLLTAFFHLSIQHKIRGGLKWRWGKD